MFLHFLFPRKTKAITQYICIYSLQKEKERKKLIKTEEKERVRVRESKKEEIFPSCFQFVVVVES